MIDVHSSTFTMYVQGIFLYGMHLGRFCVFRKYFFLPVTFLIKLFQSVGWLLVVTKAHRVVLQTLNYYFYCVINA